MVKEYRLFFAIKAVSLDETAHLVARLLGMSVTLRDGSSGNYATCEGPSADYLSIRPRNRNDFPDGIDYKQYNVQLNALNNRGKNVEKEARHNHLKRQLIKLPGFSLTIETATVLK